MGRQRERMLACLCVGGWDMLECTDRKDVYGLYMLMQYKSAKGHWGLG